MKVTLIINDPPYGSERSYNALRLADVLLKLEEDLKLAVFLLGDGVWCARAGQQTPTGFFNLERMLKPVIRHGLVLVCETCMAARGLRPEDLATGCRQAKLGELGMLVLDSDRVLSF